MTTAPHPTSPIAEQLAQLVQQTRTRLHKQRLWAGVGLLVAVVLGWLVVSVSLDLLSPLSVPVRVLAALVMWSLLIGLAAVLVIWPWWNRPSVTKVASLIERSAGGMHNRLLTVLDYAHRNGSTFTGRDGQVRRELYERLLTQTQAKLARFSIAQVAPSLPMWRNLLLASLVLMSMLLMTGLWSERVPTAVLRMLLPTADIAPVSWVRLQAIPGDVQVLQGEAVTLAAHVERGSADDLTVRLRPINSEGEPGTWTTYPLSTSAQAEDPAFTVSSVTQSMQYQIRGGGTWTDIHHITMVRRPVLETYTTAVRLPSYMKISELRSTETDTRQVSAVVGSHLIVRAKVTGDVLHGHVQLFKPQVVTKDVEQISEVVWFDDGLPRDAATPEPWRWLSDNPYSGTRAHTFNWERTPYGFTTRGERLSVEPEQSVFVYAWLDPSDRPDSLRIGWHDGQNVNWCEWGISEKAVEPIKPRTVWMGKLPEAGQWVRLQMTRTQALGGQNPGGAFKFAGMRFEIDRGRVMLDRAGVLVKSRQSITRSEPIPGQIITMKKDEATNEWVGEVMISEDALFAMSFANTAGYRSSAMQPIPIVATTDQPPALIVERPSGTVTVAANDPVPVVVRGLDDYGVEALGIQIGRAPESLGEVRWLQEYQTPVTNQVLLSAVNPQDSELRPGESMFYRMVVRDSKQQLATSEPLRIAMASPDQARAAGVAQKPAALDPLLAKLNNLLAAQTQLIGQAASFVGELPEGVATALKSVTITKPDGTALTVEEMRELYKMRLSEMTPQQIQQMRAINQQIQEQEKAATELAMQLEQAAQQAQDSPLTLPIEAATLKKLAERARELAAENQEALQPLGLQGQNPEQTSDMEALQRLAALQELSPEQRAQMQAMQEQMRQMIAAQQAMGQQPDQAQMQMAALMAQMQAQQAQQRMQQLAEHLQNERAQMLALEQQIQAMQAMTAQASAAQMDQLSQQQQELDPQALERLKAAQQLLQERLAAIQEGQGSMPPAPWVPPGERVEAQPVERDTPEKDAQAIKQNNDAAEQSLEQAKADEPKEEELNWWDQPVNMGGDNFTLEENQRFRDRDTRPNELGQAPQPGAPTPRQLLQEHQGELQQALTQSADQLGGAQADVRAMAAQMEAMADQLGQQLAGAQAPPNVQSDQAALQQAMGQSMAQLQQMMQATNLQQAMSMAARAAMQQAMQQAQMQAAGQAQGPQAQGQPTQQMQNAQMQAMQGMMGMMMPSGSAMESLPGAAAPGVVMSIDLSGMGMTSTQGSAVYRLPPKVRDSLLTGMREKGPEGYQELIDAYYRSLSEQKNP